MKIRVLIDFAWKGLWSHRMRAILTIGAVSIGISAIVFLVSLGFGLERLVTEQVANFNAFTIIDVPSANLKTGKINQEAIERIEKIGHIASVDQVVDLAGRVHLGADNSSVETVVVAVEQNYFRLAEIPLKTGRFFRKGADNEVVINAELANMLGLKTTDKDLGKTLSLDMIISEDLRAADLKEGPITKSVEKLKIVGITNDKDGPIIYLPLSIARANEVINSTTLKIKVDDPDEQNVERIRKAIENTGFSTEYIGDTTKQINQVFSLFRIILGGFGLIALVVAALGTFNTLTISLMERIREVGLLKILGMKRKAIFKLFITESLIIGVFGGILGIALGSLVGWSMNMFLRYLANQADAEAVAIYYTPPLFFLIAFMGSLLVGFFTGFYPAYKAIKTSALDALRYE